MKKLSMDELHRLSIDDFKSAPKTPLTVVLDNVRSQNNIGSVFRTADAFRLEGVALCGICSTPPHRDIHKTALGAELSVDWQYFEKTSHCVSQLKSNGYTVFAVEQVDDSVKLDDISSLLDRFPNIGRAAVIFGNEVEGVSDDVLPLCDASVEIPQFGTKHSLNVSCAAAIVMWEMWKLLSLARQ